MKQDLETAGQEAAAHPWEVLGSWSQPDSPPPSAIPRSRSTGREDRRRTGDSGIPAMAAGRGSIVQKQVNHTASVPPS